MVDAVNVHDMQSAIGHCIHGMAANIQHQQNETITSDFADVHDDYEENDTHHKTKVDQHKLIAPNANGQKHLQT